VAGAAVLVAAVGGGLLAMLPDGGDDDGDGKARAAGSVAPTGGATGSPAGEDAKGGGTGPRPPSYIEATGPSRDQWASDPNDAWAGGRCNLPPEELNQHFQYAKPSESDEIASGKVTITMRLRYAEPDPGETYYVAAVVKPPHDIPASEAKEGGFGLAQNLGLGFTSKPVDLYAMYRSQGASSEVKLTYPDDFSLYVNGERRSGALPLADDPGDWTVRFVHVKAAKEFTGIACDGFTVAE
jgi:hypothetical protein